MVVTSGVVFISCTLIFGGGVMAIFRGRISLDNGDPGSAFSLPGFVGDDDGEREASWVGVWPCIDTWTWE